MTFVDETVRVSVPATSANLGPGFDCLGLALSLRDELTARVVDGPSSITVAGEGADEVPLDDAARRQRFALEVAASGMVWGLYGDTWARSPAAGEAEALPFWSSAGQAARCSTGAWEGFVPRAIERDAFVEQWLAGMDEDGIVAVLLPTPTEPGAIVGAAELGQALARAAS